MKEFTHKSVAIWPQDVYGRGGVTSRTEDEHYSEEEAEGVCRLLERHGFGGGEEVFPLETWVEEI